MEEKVHLLHSGDRRSYFLAFFLGGGDIKITTEQSYVLKINLTNPLLRRDHAAVSANEMP